MTAFLEAPLIKERWLHLSYTYGGVFLLSGAPSDADSLKQDMWRFYDAAKAQRLKKFPRGYLARYILVPIYCSSAFSIAAKELLYSNDRPGAWGISMSPVLFNSATNVVEYKDGAQNQTLPIYAFFSDLASCGVGMAAKHFGVDPCLTVYV
jgi:hypothetical protein